MRGFMPSAKHKRIRERLEQIKSRSSQENAAQKTKGGVTGYDLAEEAASLGLEVLDEKEK